MRAIVVVGKSPTDYHLLQHLKKFLAKQRLPMTPTCRHIYNTEHPPPVSVSEDMGRNGRGLLRNPLTSANTARGTDPTSSGRPTQNLQTRGTLCRNTRVPVVITLCTSPTLTGPLPPRPHWAN
ncbi:hypothetical protein AVEN_108591-1 [Araneus ventricosus]|uniref:Uncharacterized protein n=1 Tax=Araneus ventricosus TaxID=182803 RepID=A0A4Y2DJG4_ARAVE|nr:hypothetical protein AVEN_108591-1 [Araneus ventricosus]